MKKVYRIITIIFLFLNAPFICFASEADLKIPEAIHSEKILYWGFLITILGF